MRRQLALKNPHLEGEDVREVQRKLGLKGDALDGDFGLETAFRIEEWKWQMGYPTSRINSTLGLPGLGLLFGEIAFPADFRQRAERTEGQAFAPSKTASCSRSSRPNRESQSSSSWRMRGHRTNTGVKHHAGLDWFAPAGAVVRAPVAGRIIEAKPSTKTSGQVFGGTVKIEAADRKVWIFRHVVPNVGVGDSVAAGRPVAAISQWDDGPEHAHIEIRKTNEGGHVFENMLDPLSFF